MLSQTPTIPFHMHAVVMHERGGPDVLKYETVPTPNALGDDVLVRVEAATVNHTDLFHRTGQFHIQKSLPHILGMDVAGTVASVGPKAKNFRIGERVVATFEALGRERDGAYAEYAVVPEGQLHRVPDKLLDMKAAACIGLAFTTAWIALVDEGQIGPGHRVLIHAASSGVGTAAIQIARWRGAHVIAVASARKADRLQKLGAHLVLPPDYERLPRHVRDATRDKGVTHVLELVGHDSFASSLACLASGGRILCVGTLSGDVSPLNIMDLMMCRGTVKGVYGTLQPGSYEQILDLFAAGTLSPVIDRVLPLRKAAEAHALVERRETFGKVVLDPWIP